MISGLEGLGAALTSLELGGNKIRVRRGSFRHTNSRASQPFPKENRRSGRAREPRRVMAWKEQDNETRGMVFHPPRNDAVSERCILESRKLETPEIIIDAIEPSDKARELGGTREPRRDLPKS